MNNKFESTKYKAIILGKELLKYESGKRRLCYSTVKETISQCRCGEAKGVVVTARIDGENIDTIITICKKCFKH